MADIAKSKGGFLPCVKGSGKLILLHGIARAEQSAPFYVLQRNVGVLIMMVSSLLFSSVLKVERKIRVFFIGLFGMGMISVICGVIPPVYAGRFFFAACCIGLGASGNVHTIPLTAYIQETVATEKMGRAFSVLTLISSVTMPAGLLFSSPIAEKVGVNVWFFISGLSIIVLTLIVVIRYTLKQRRISI